MKYLVVLMTCLLVCTHAAPKPEEAAAPATGSQLEMSQQQISELFKNAQSMLTDLWANIKNTYVPDNQVFADTVKTQSAAFVTKVQEYMNQFSNEIKEKTPELEKQWAEVQNNLKKIIDGVNANVPNAKESAEQLHKQFQEGVQAFVKEATSISEKFKENGGQVQEEIATFTKQAINTAVEATKGLNDQLKNFSGPATEKSS